MISRAVSHSYVSRCMARLASAFEHMATHMPAPSQAELEMPAGGMCPEPASACLQSIKGGRGGGGGPSLPSDPEGRAGCLEPHSITGHARQAALTATGEAACAAGNAVDQRRGT